MSRTSPRTRSPSLRDASPAEILRATITLLADQLPRSWTVQEVERSSSPKHRANARISIRAPDGQGVEVLMEAKRLLQTRDVTAALDGLRRAQAELGTDAVLMLVARYLPSAARARIVEDGGSYADAAGNLYLESTRPGLLLRETAADSDPWRGPGRPRRRLRGPPAARVVRALVDLPGPMSMLDLAAAAKASTGTTYRVVDLLAEEELIERRRQGPITHVHRRAVLERWSQEYSFETSGTVTAFVEPRGLEPLLDRLRSVGELGYALTGTLAAHDLAPYAEARTAAIYVRDVDEAADRLGLRPAEAGANVFLSDTDYDVVFERARNADGLRCVAPSQAAVDLLTGPGRNPSEAVALLDWLEHHDAVWRS